MIWAMVVAFKMDITSVAGASSATSSCWLSAYTVNWYRWVSPVGRTERRPSRFVPSEFAPLERTGRDAAFDQPGRIRRMPYTSQCTNRSASRSTTESASSTVPGGQFDHVSAGDSPTSEQVCRAGIGVAVDPRGEERRTVPVRRCPSGTTGRRRSWWRVAGKTGSASGLARSVATRRARSSATQPIEQGSTARAKRGEASDTSVATGSVEGDGLSHERS